MTKNFLKKNWKVLILIFIAIGWRYCLSFLTAHGDLSVQTEWGRWMYNNKGVRGLYEWRVWEDIWPNHPPLISFLYYLCYEIHSDIMGIFSWLGNFIALHRLAPTKFIWFFNFIIWFGSAKYKNTISLMGVMVVIKQFMIIADLLIAAVIFRIGKIYKKDWKKPVLFYLFLPFSWYLAAVWCQSDQLSFLFFIIAIGLLMSKKYVWVSPLLYSIAANLKPNCALLIPLYLFIWYKQKYSFKKLILGTLIAVGFTYWTVTWFTDSKILPFILFELSKRLNTSNGLTTLNAFNFWFVLHPYPTMVTVDTVRFLGITAKCWGWILFLITTLISFKAVVKDKLETMFGAMFIAAYGSCLFLTGMHERYAFLGIVPLLFYSIFELKTRKYFMILSIIYFLSLFYVFSFPQSWDLIKVIFVWKLQLIPRLLSMVNILIYGRVTSMILKKSDHE